MLVLRFYHLYRLIAVFKNRYSATPKKFPSGLTYAGMLRPQCNTTQYSSIQGSRLLSRSIKIPSNLGGELRILDMTIVRWDVSSRVRWRVSVAEHSLGTRTSPRCVLLQMQQTTGAHQILHVVSLLCEQQSKGVHHYRIGRRVKVRHSWPSSPPPGYRRSPFPQLFCLGQLTLLRSVIAQRPGSRRRGRELLVPLIIGTAWNGACTVPRHDAAAAGGVDLGGKGGERPVPFQNLVHAVHLDVCFHGMQLQRWAHFCVFSCHSSWLACLLLEGWSRL